MSARRPFALAGAAAGALLIAASLTVAREEPSADVLPPAATDAPASPEPAAEAGIALAIDAPALADPPVAAPRASAPLPEGWRVRVPRVGIDLPLRDGDLERDVVAQRTPEGAAFRLPGTAFPGAGNTVLYAHARAGMFIALWSARVGDRVELRAPDGRLLAYRLIEIHPRVPATDITYLVPSDDERITLQTSTGPRSTDPRFVAVARPER